MGVTNWKGPQGALTAMTIRNNISAIDFVQKHFLVSTRTKPCNYQKNRYNIFAVKTDF